MNGFNSKVVCKNSSVTIWEILFNVAILITRGGFIKRLQYAPPGRTQRGVNENVSPVSHSKTGECYFECKERSSVKSMA